MIIFNIMNNFKKFLDKNNISYVVNNDKLIITHDDNFEMSPYYEYPLPENLTFANNGDIDLRFYLTIHKLPKNLTFANNGNIRFGEPKFPLPEDIVFENFGDLHLQDYNFYHPNTITFNNKGCVFILLLSNWYEKPKKVIFSNHGDVCLFYKYISNPLKKYLDPVLDKFHLDAQHHRGYNTTQLINIEFSNFGNVYAHAELDFYSSSNVVFKNIGNVILHKNKLEHIKKYSNNKQSPFEFENKGFVGFKDTDINNPLESYIKRYNIPIIDNNIILYRYITCHDFYDGNSKVLCTPNTIIENNNWNPNESQQVSNIFKGCAKPEWCDMFRKNKLDKLISIQVNINNLHEWLDYPLYPQIIGFSKGIVLGEVNQIK